MGQHDTARHDRTQRQQVAELWRTAIVMAAAVPHRVTAPIERLASYPSALVDEQGSRILLDRVGTWWSHGWQPTELRRELRRRTRATTGRLAELVILVDHERRSGQALDPRWAEQLQQLGQRTLSTRGSWLSAWRRHESLDHAECWATVAALARAATELATLDVLIPPPGADPTAVSLGAPERGRRHHPMLERVRKLLSKAEATDFEEEAATFTAKAQELMTRHAIDEAQLHATGQQDRPRMVRLPVDAPYVDGKSALLGAVAAANRCRAIQLTGLDMSSVVGHADDLAMVELLFTSLLVQAHHALTEVGRGLGGRHARGRGFRSSFYLAYASRIGERLGSVNDRVVADDGAPAALPVLRAREIAVDELVEAHYGGRLTTGAVRGGYDDAGLAYGRAAADRARLDSGAITR